MKSRYRKRGVPLRLKKSPGIAAETNIRITDGDGWPMAKLVVFRRVRDMVEFHDRELPVLMGFSGVRYSLKSRCRGLVNKLTVEDYFKETEEFDRRFFCLVGLVERHLTARILAHEAVHVGFAWDKWTHGSTPFPEGEEENVCYPAGIFFDKALTFIKEQVLKEK